MYIKFRSKELIFDYFVFNYLSGPDWLRLSISTKAFINPGLVYLQITTTTLLQG